MTTTITTVPRPLFDEAHLAVAGFLARYAQPTRRSYASDRRQYFAWCDSVDLGVFEAKRPHLEQLSPPEWCTRGSPGSPYPPDATTTASAFKFAKNTKERMRGRHHTMGAAEPLR